jgi:FkbM family methyltransferase
MNLRMSRFLKLKYHLGFAAAAKLVLHLRIGRLDGIKMEGLLHPFTMRNNPSDYAIFMEVLVRKEYSLPFSFNPKTIIDAGGNIGLTAAFFSSRFPDAVVVTVEPDKENFETLTGNVTPYKNITALNKGIWTHTSFLNVIDKGHGESCFTVEETNTPTAASVAAIAIHEIMQEQQWETIDLLKIDIEGTEKNIFEKGYEQWLPYTKVLVVETHDRMKKGCSAAVFKAVGQYNFSCTVAGENFLFTNDDLLKS